MNWLKTTLISLAILIAAAAVIALIFNTEPVAQRTGASIQTAMLVDVESVERRTHNPVFTAVGTVTPSQDITLNPQISGLVTRMPERFTPGNYVNKGDTLLQIDSTDYYYTALQRRGEYDQAVANLNIELGLQDVSQKEFRVYDTTDLSDRELTEQQKNLFLRQPQLQSAKASVDMAEAAFRMAKLQLDRTTIQAPFDAQIVARNVNVGSQVAPGTSLGRLVGIDTYWAEISIPISKVEWLEFGKSSDSRGSEVRIRNRTAWAENQTRTGYLYKLLGTLENQTRMARILVTIPDPLNRDKQTRDTPALIIGSFVEVQIKGRNIENSVRLDRDFVRENGTVWVMKDDSLDIRNVTIDIRDAEYAYVTKGLEHGERVVTSDLATVREGVPLRIRDGSLSENEQINSNP